MKFYSIQSVAQISGLSAHCIRAWEKRYGAIKPLRSENGRRMYTEAELNRLILLGKLSSMGNAISLIANIPDEELIKLLDKMTLKNGKEEAKCPKNLLEPKSYLTNMLMALSTYKLDVLTHELNKASSDLSCRDFALEVVANLFRKVGEDVSKGVMSIAQEHTLSALTKFFIGKRIGLHYLSIPKVRFKVTLATPVGEHHSIGLLLSSLLMSEYGIPFVYLGEDLPIESIADAARATDSDAVLIGISPAYKHSLNDDILNLRKRLPAKTQIWIGGAVDTLSPSTIRTTGIVALPSLYALDEKLSRLAIS
jgi:DNA-binding transcriptional MerR regulator/methylmalonyl-CoA mutase cobalamin-binding subunit